MNDTWNPGPPPAIGWWPASAFKDATSLRWWNGTSWSATCRAGFTSNQIDDALEWEYTPIASRNPILWTQRPSTWPEASKT